jgi:arylsulfatase A-like enzyme
MKFSVLTALVTAFLVTASSAADRPNIVFIFSDDHSPNAIGAYKRWLKSVNPTPNIDKLAARAWSSSAAYCTNSICGPVRAVIETGKHSHLNGFRQNGDKFNWDQQTFPKIAPGIRLPDGALREVSHGGKAEGL